MKKKYIAGVLGTVGVIAAIAYAAITLNKFITDDEFLLSDFGDEE
jgi:hypothetical protein